MISASIVCLGIEGGGLGAWSFCLLFFVGSFKAYLIGFSALVNAI